MYFLYVYLIVKQAQIIEDLIEYIEVNEEMINLLMNDREQN